MKSIDQFITNCWQTETLEGLKNFIRIPAKSKNFDPNWAKNGYLKQALEQAVQWGQRLFPEGTFTILEAPGLTPTLFFDIPANQHVGQPVFFYGHLDKQPETQGWAEGLGPWEPVIREGRLYGRGSSDDGYSFYMALTAVYALKKHQQSYPRVVGLYETDEESGSQDLPHYLKQVAPLIGSPACLCILDLSCKDYQRLWHTQSLRGVVMFELHVKVLDRPVHSGVCSGLVPSSFAVMRALLDRLEDPLTGQIKLSAFHTTIPVEHEHAMTALANLLGDQLYQCFPYAQSTQPRTTDLVEAIKRMSWQPSLSILGQDGLPSLQNASALLRTHTALTLSFRIPPYVDSQKALQQAIDVLTHDVPCNAVVEIKNAKAEDGFDAPMGTPWLMQAMHDCSVEVFGHAPGQLFEGASIGTMKHFQQAFPNSPFLNTGVLGPLENAHAPNESIHLGYATQLTQCLARLLQKVPQ